jgi:hypothetical protein
VSARRGLLGAANQLQLDKLRSIDAPVYSSGLLGLRFPGETKEDVERSMVRLFSRLPVRSDILREVALVRREARLDGPYTVVHVRRGDIPSTIRRESADVEELDPHSVLAAYLRYYATRSAPLVVFERTVATELEGGRCVVVTSDDPGALAWLRQRLPKATFLQDVSRAYLEIRRAFVDFLVMSQAAKIIGCSGSAYAQFAHVVGGQPFIDLVLDGSEEERSADIRELMQGRAPVLIERACAAVELAHQKARDSSPP